MTRAEFIVKALKLANDKARELGWIVYQSPQKGTPTGLNCGPSRAEA